MDGTCAKLVDSDTNRCTTIQKSFWKLCLCARSVGAHSPGPKDEGVQSEQKQMRVTRCSLWIQQELGRARIPGRADVVERRGWRGPCGVWVLVKRAGFDMAVLRTSFGDHHTCWAASGIWLPLV